jgi:hypothetical protein
LYLSRNAAASRPLPIVLPRTTRASNLGRATPLLQRRPLLHADRRRRVGNTGTTPSTLHRRST